MVKLLVIESTEPSGCVAMWEGEKPLLEITPNERSARALAPAIQQGLNTVGWKPKEVDCVAVSLGPGSFTGIRVGLATATLFAYATGANIVGIDTLQTLAGAAGPPFSPLLPGIRSIAVAVDAQRGELFAQTFAVSDSEKRFAIPVPLNPAGLVSVADWFSSHDHATTLFSGPVLHRITERSPDAIASDIRLLEPTYWNVNVSVLARLALVRIATNDFDTITNLAPIYSRPSAAEEKRNNTLETAP